MTLPELSILSLLFRTLRADDRSKLLHGGRRQHDDYFDEHGFLNPVP
jgi:hypothetical protein